MITVQYILNLKIVKILIDKIFKILFTNFSYILQEVSMNNGLESSVKFVQNLVNEQYPIGLPLFKELIQNANDAGSKILIIGISNTINSFKNPLLKKAPAIYIINDSIFSADDNYYIKQLSASSKKSEATIGKFGLGLKTLYNYCEGYFLLVSDIVDGKRQAKPIMKELALITPWEEKDESYKEDNPYYSWWKSMENKNEQTHDRNTIIEIVQEHISNLKQWFCLWVPLRVHDTIIENNYIIDNFSDNIDEAKIFSSDIIAKVGQIMPMMGSLKKIVFINSKKESVVIDKITGEGISLSKMSQRCRELNEEPVWDQSEVVFYNQNKTNRIRSLLRHGIYINSKINGLIDSKSKTTFEKEIIPHYGVLITEDIGNSKNDVNLFDSCLLPLSNDVHESKYNFYVHGNYFINSSRTSIITSEDSNNETTREKQAKWNESLKTTAYSCLIPLLSKHLLVQKKSHNDVSELTKSLKKTINKERLIQDICNDYCWVERLFEDGFRWSIIASDNKAYEVTNNMFKLLGYAKKLKQLMSLNILINRHDYNIIKKENINDWTEEIFDAYVDLSIVDLLNDEELFDNWIKDIKFLKHKDKYVNILSNYVKEFLKNITLKELSENKKITHLLNLVENNIICLSIKSNDVFNKLNEFSAYKIVLPMDDNKRNMDNISEEDLYSLLHIINSAINTNNANEYHEISLQILFLMKGLYFPVKLKSLNLFEIKDSNGNSSAISYDDLENKFVVTAKSSNNLIKAYESAFPTSKIFKINIEYKTNEASLLQVFNKKFYKLECDLINKRVNEFAIKVSDNVDERIDLLKEFLKNGERYSKIIRTLLIGNNIIDNRTIYIAKVRDFNYKVTKFILSNSDESYRIILDENDTLNIQKLRSIGIKILSFIPSEILSDDLKDLSLDVFSSEFNNIQKQLKDNINIKYLPIYKTIKSDYIALTDSKIYMLNKDSEGIPNVESNIKILEFNKEIEYCLEHLDNIIILDDVHKLEIILSNSHQFDYNEILNLLNNIEKRELVKYPEIKSLVEKTKWLPLKNGNHCSLNQVLHNTHYEKDIENILHLYESSKDLKSNLFIKYQFDENFTKHVWFDRIQQLNLYISDEEVWSHVGEILKYMPELSIGKIDCSLITDVIEYLSPLNKSTILDYLAKWKTNVGRQIIYDYILPSVTILNPDLEQKVEVLKTIEELCLRNINNDNIYKKMKKLHLDILYSHLSEAPNIKILENIKLPNENEKWIDTSKLCLPKYKANSKHILQNEYASKISRFLKDTVHNEATDFRFDSSDIVIKYLTDIASEKKSLSKLIGLFLSFLADKDKIWSCYVQEFIDKTEETKINATKHKIFTNNESYINLLIEGRKDFKHYNCPPGLSRITDITCRKLSINPLDDFQIRLWPTEQKETKEVSSILGNMIIVESRPLLIEKPSKNFLTDTFIYKFYLNQDKDSVEKLLKEAIYLIFEDIYLINMNKKPLECFEDLWDILSKTDQIDIKITQARILQDMTFYFRRFNKLNDTSIKEIIEKIESLEKNRAIDDVNKISNKSYGSEEKAIKEMIRKVIQKQHVQEELTKSVVRELEKAQYSKQSTFFELFQNADDAYVENEILGIANSDYSFNIVKTDGIIKIFHYGRKINFINRNKNKKEEIEGYGNDLYNMLSLNISNKDNESVTGKYGLGFKTVYFISKNVVVISGDIAIKTLGSMYPEKLNVEEKESYLNDLNKDKTTLFILQLYDSKDIELIEGFEKISDFLPIFSKSIKKVKINTRDYTWNKEKFNSNLYISPYSDNKLLTFAGNKWKIVFAYNNKGFQRLESDKRVWVTVPTKTKSSYQILINADFNIDIGRTQLASDDNLKIFEQIGKEFYQILKDLFESDEYPLGVDRLDFWTSLFDLLSYPENNDELNSIFWSNNYNCYKSLLSEIEIVPNEFDEVNELTTTTIIELYIKKELNKYKHLCVLFDIGFPIEKSISEETYNILCKHSILCNIEKIDVDNFTKYSDENKLKEYEDEIQDTISDLKSIRSSSDPVKQLKEKVKLNQEWEEKKKEQSNFGNQDRYSFGWFKSIVEAMNITDKNDNTPQKGSSKKIKFYSNCVNENKNLLTFTESSGYLMQSYETAEECLIYIDNSKNPLDIRVRGITIIGKSLDILFKSVLTENQLNDIKKSNFIKVEFKSYAKISKIILEAYLSLNLITSYDFKKKLPKSIEFIYGPPGTGKTYTSAAYIRENKELNILVLTPTNRAADQIYQELINQCKANKDDSSYVYRYGNTTLDLNENELGNTRPSTVITTAIRFPYDRVTNYSYKIQDNKWDLIVFDESSMISIETINYIINKSHHINKQCKYFIVGDPKQIPPIYNFNKKGLTKQDKTYIESIEEDLKGDKNHLGRSENIYTMVNLYSFKKQEQRTEPWQYKINNLTVQRRSIKEIGSLYSEFSYNGLIKHSDDKIERKNFNFEIFDDNPIQIVEFPITGGRIYQSIKVDKSHAHPYSAILIMELLKAIDSNENKSTNIGVVSAYRPQVNLLEKLIGKHSFNRINVQVDTVHGFQGSEKDVMICCFNPPISYKNDVPEVSKSNLSLINKEYIVNVAISRAKSKLIIMLPENYTKFRQLKDLKSFILNKSIPSYSIEKEIFNRKDYIHYNSSVIPHDQVNVYQAPPRKYLISYDDHSIDIQIEPNKR